MSNFFREYASYCSEITDAPDCFHRFVAYAVAATAIGKNCYFPFGDNNIYPNLWVILIAPSSEFRKSTALSIGSGILRKVDPSLVLLSRFTEEAFISMLAATPHGMIPFYEFKSLLDLVKKDYNAGLKSLLTEIFDVPDILSRKTKASEESIERPCISIVAATTMEWFLNSCKEDDFASGFLPRFLFVPVSQKSNVIPIPPPANKEKKQGLIDAIKEIRTIRGEFSFSDTAKKIHNHWYQKLRDRHKIPQFIGIYSRLQIYLIKLAMIHSIAVERSLQISEESMNSAIKLVDWLISQFEGLASTEFTFTKFEQQKKKVLDKIRSGMTSRSHLLRNCNVSAKVLDEIVRTLIESDQIKQINDQSGILYHEVTA